MKTIGAFVVCVFLFPLTACLATAAAVRSTLWVLGGSLTGEGPAITAIFIIFLVLPLSVFGGYVAFMEVKDELA